MSNNTLYNIIKNRDAKEGKMKTKLSPEMLDKLSKKFIDAKGDIDYTNIFEAFKLNKKETNYIVSKYFENNPTEALKTFVSSYTYSSPSSIMYEAILSNIIKYNLDASDRDVIEYIDDPLQSHDAKPYRYLEMVKKVKIFEKYKDKFIFSNKQNVADSTFLRNYYKDFSKERYEKELHNIEEFFNISFSGIGRRQ